MRQWWLDLSIAKKLYAVVGIMATLIAAELFTLLFAMDTLSSIRSFIAGESFWSKAQKNAIYRLHRYVSTKEEVHYTSFQESLQVSLGDRQARLELEKPNPDFEKVRQGFIQGQNHPDDVEGLIELIVRFHSNKYILEALQVWRAADELFYELIEVGDEIHRMVSSQRPDPEKLQQALSEVDLLNSQLTALENRFSLVLGEGSRWLEKVLMLILILAVLTVETTGLLLTIAFSRNLNRSLAELNDMAQAVGKGNFSLSIPVRSKDELGRLAGSINRMAEGLQKITGQKVIAENASQAKNLYLASMSHEIRTPLGVILGLTEVLKDPSLTMTDRFKYIETIEKTGQNLTRIINDILDISKVESGHLDIKKSSFSLAEFMNELSAMMTVKAEKEQNTFIITKHGEFADLIYSDRTRLKQILVNLINNALKFTKNGTVTLNYCKKDSQLCFEVTDTGVGILPEHQGRIFQAFSQESDRPQGQEGSGLGLAISKKLAQALGGDVSLKESSYGKGSTFLATIKYEQARDEAALSQAKPSPKRNYKNTGGLSGKKILVVEDVIDNQMLTKLYLARKGMTVQFANNGEEGVEKALSEDYDLILMDMQMPIKDGYTATRELREKGYYKPIIALTAHAMKEDREKCLQAGCDDYLTKPLDSGVLYDAISKNLERSYIDGPR